MLSVRMTEAGAPEEWIAKALRLEREAAQGRALLAGLDHAEATLRAVRRVATSDSVTVLVEQEGTYDRGQSGVPADSSLW